jgi:protein phosphatase
VDHEVGQREIQRGVEPAIAYARPDAYQLTQALGPRGSKDVVPSITSLPVMEDMLLLLCSDGLSDNDVLEHHVTTHVEPLLRSRHDLEEGVSQLIDLANEQNGHDNITALVVRLKLRPNLEALRG